MAAEEANHRTQIRSIGQIDARKSEFARMSKRGRRQQQHRTVEALGRKLGTAPEADKAALVPLLFLAASLLS